MMKNGQTPVFTAITFDPATNSRLVTVINNLDSYAEASACHPEPEVRLHLTLNYRPFVDPIEPLIERLSALDLPSFDLCLRKFGLFKNKDRDVIWMDVDGDLEALVFLREAAEREFASMGYTGGTGIYRPHITLAYAKEAKLLSRAKDIFPADEDTAFTVTAFHLFREVKDDHGIHFDLIHTFPLKAKTGETDG